MKDTKKQEIQKVGNIDQLEEQLSPLNDVKIDGVQYSVGINNSGNAFCIATLDFQHFSYEFVAMPMTSTNVCGLVKAYNQHIDMSVETRKEMVEVLSALIGRIHIAYGVY
jgi:hypothetical protein